MDDRPEADGAPAESMSASQIDELLRSVSAGAVASAVAGGGEPSPKRIRVHDFLRPPVLSPGDLERTAALLGPLADVLASGLSRVFRARCALSLCSADTMILGDYLRSCPAREVFALFGLPARRGDAEDGVRSAVFSLPESLARDIAGASLGGHVPQKDAPDPRFPSDLEREVLASVLQDAFRPFLAALVPDGAGRLPRIAVGPAEFPPAAPAETLLLSVFSLARPMEQILKFLIPAEEALRILEPAGNGAPGTTRGLSDAVWLAQELRFPAGRMDRDGLAAAAAAKRIDMDPYRTGRRLVMED